MSFVPTPSNMNFLEQSGVPHALPVSTWVDDVAISSTHAEYNVAAAKTAMGLAATESLFAILSGDEAFWYNPNGTAVAGTGTTNGTGSVYVPGGGPKKVYLDETITSLSFVAASAGHVSIEFYKP